jgi:hypothetical protein
MDSAYVRNEVTKALLSQQQVPFVRLPEAGDMIFTPPGNWWSVVRTVHGWSGAVPVAEVHVTPATALTSTPNMQTSHF